MKTVPFKLRSGNKPSIAKLSGISPLKDEISDAQYAKEMDEMDKSGEMDKLKKEVKSQNKYDKERNRRLDILDKDYPEIVSQKGSPGAGYKKIKGTNIYKHTLGVKKGRDQNSEDIFFGDTKENRFKY